MERKVTSFKTYSATNEISLQEINTPEIDILWKMGCLKI